MHAAHCTANAHAPSASAVPAPHTATPTGAPPLPEKPRNALIRLAHRVQRGALAVHFDVLARLSL
ncbi:MAG: hypothetical protein A3J25_10375 [Pseudomonadales bacterium RIFCSPLOWO2_02_FULL_63_210]|nr:MAG: hypothetical protein A3J25_10375 [Pseudomonadales bacterium RIFCSPLOWO2_02_FULL_63_210]